MSFIAFVAFVGRCQRFAWLAGLLAIGCPYHQVSPIHLHNLQSQSLPHAEVLYFDLIFVTVAVAAIVRIRSRCHCHRRRRAAVLVVNLIVAYAFAFDVHFVVDPLPNHYPSHLIHLHDQQLPMDLLDLAFCYYKKINER